MKVQLDNDAIVSRMKQACQVRKDAELARYLDETTGAVSSWRTATYPPFNACYTVADKTGVSMDWILSGKDSISSVSVSMDYHHANREQFITKFMEALNYGIRLGLLQKTEDVIPRELERLGYLLFNESIGQTEEHTSSPKPTHTNKPKESDSSIVQSAE